jgi:hypothetical protein
MNKDLKKVALEIRSILDKKREELGLTFIEENHIYFMKDKDGNIRNDFPSVSKVLKLFYEEFPTQEAAYKKAKGDEEEMERLITEWVAAGEYATNMGSRVHYELETETIKRNGDYKEVRKPIFEIDLIQEMKSNSMILAGKKFLKLMEERGAILLDTEMVLGHPELGYTGQPDKIWLIFNKDKTGFGLVITDWKTNKVKNFQTNDFTKSMYNPFDKYPNNQLGHYYLQLPLYGKLLIKMLEGTKYENLKLYGSVVVLLKDNADFEEFRVPKEVQDIILSMDITKKLKK